ncbi:hypothetical protein Cantr_07593 [Candida viswanathii]|uniref:Factor arrest protein 7 n=1 Tax=Candida viswanathii TaxID=5486 RepID=A0A367Y1R5_9ASCO|nr:hypothetical protein Cantr_07593 [Candida viswanathii]
MPDPAPYPLTNYYFLLKTENLNPLIDAINQITQEITHNQTIIDSLSTTITKETGKSTEDDVAVSDPLHYLLEQKYNLPKPAVPSDSRESYAQNLRDDITHLRRIQRQKKNRNRELVKILEKYQDEISNVLLPGLRVLIGELLSSKNEMVRVVEDMKNDVVLNEVYDDYLKYVRFVWGVFEKLKVLVELISE